MATLQGTKIKDTYAGILKTTANDGLGAADRRITSGDGTESVLELSEQALKINSPGLGSASFEADVTSVTMEASTAIALRSDNTAITSADGVSQGFGISGTQTTFAGTVDFSLATVNGLPSGAGGLELGTGAATQEGAPLSMQSGDSVSTIAAQARGGGDIAIGEAAITPVGGPDWPTWSIAIGGQATVAQEKGLSVGFDTYSVSKATAIGFVASAGGANSVAVGNASNATGGSSIAIGNTASATNSNATQVGAFAGASGQGSTSLGWAAGATTTYSIGIGRLSGMSGGNEQIAIGNFAKANSEKGIAIGPSTSTTAAGAVALGRDVSATKADTVTVTELETALVGGGITMYSPDGTEYKLTIANGGTLNIVSA